MNRNEQPAPEVDSGRLAGEPLEIFANPSVEGFPCPSDESLRSVVLGEADTLWLDRLADHLNACRNCVQRLERITNEARETCRQDYEEPHGTVHSVQTTGELQSENSVVSSEPMFDAILIGRYRLGRCIGQGGMGKVYEATDIVLHRKVAVKMLRLDLLSANSFDRFEREARAQATLNHAHIVSLFEFGQHRGFPFFVMEHVAGGPLSAILRDRVLAPGIAARLTMLIARAVEHAHQKSLLHRDLKPSNILIGSSVVEKETGIENPFSSELGHSWNPKIADFGLARMFNLESDHTRSDGLVGTVAYLAPERTTSGQGIAGPESDVYAIGVILYECLTGRTPFRGEDALQTLAMIRDQAPVPPSELKPGLSIDLQTICLKCLEKEPERRYRSAGELADDLQRLLDDRPIKARPLGPIGRNLRWCRRNPVAAASLAIALGSLMILSIGGWITAGIQSDLRAQAQAKTAEARNLAENEKAMRKLAEHRRDQAIVQFLKGTTALQIFGETLDEKKQDRDAGEAILKLRNLYRTELAKLADDFLSSSDFLADLPLRQMQVLSISSISHARNGNITRSEELFRKLEAVVEANGSAENFATSRFYVLNTAQQLGMAYKKAARAKEAIAFYRSCLNRWDFDPQHPNASPLVISMLLNSKVSYRKMILAAGLDEPYDELDMEIAELGRTLAKHHSKTH